MRYWLEEKRDCMYCGGNGRCYTCSGSGEADWLPCPDCEDSRGDCPNCENGKETWLFFTRGDGKRGSCLTRAEIAAWRKHGTLPEWWVGYHGVSA